MKTKDSSETIAASDLKRSRCRHLIELMEICEKLKVKIISWLKVVYIQTSNWIFSEKTLPI